MKVMIAVLASAVIFLILDMIWLGYVAHGFYREQIGPLLADPINIPAAIAFYALFMVGVGVFVIAPAVASGGGWWHALIYGALFGLVAYGTYDLTNLATLKGWAVRLSVVDMAWGAVVTGLASAMGVAVSERFYGG